MAEIAVKGFSTAVVQSLGLVGSRAQFCPVKLHPTNKPDSKKAHSQSIIPEESHG